MLRLQRHPLHELFQLFSKCYVPVNVTRTRTIQFARMHTSSLINIEKVLNRPVAKFYNSVDVNVIGAELRLNKTRPTSFHKKNNLL